MIRRAVSLFSNCGAGDLGYRDAGFRFEVLAEIDVRRLEVAALNHPEASTVPGDLRETWPVVVRKYRAAAGDEVPWLLAACPPCQGVSSARGRRGSGDDPDAGSRDRRNLLVVPIAQIAKTLRPRVVVVENVPAFFSRLVRHPDTQQGISAAHLLVELLAEDYVMFPLLTDLAHYGVPQTRRRAFMTFVRRSEPGFAMLTSRDCAPYPRPTHVRPERQRRLWLRATLKRFNLPKLDASTPTKARAPRYPLHVVPVWADRRYAIIAAIPSGSGGSAWETSRCEMCGPVTAGRKIATCPRCKGPLLRPVVKSGNGRWRLVRGFASSYRRMRPDMPAATITTASGHIGSDLTVHPFENRLLSPLECARLQTFPGRFQWGRSLVTWGHTFVRDMIGEAVPPHFTERHGRAILKMLALRPKHLLADRDRSVARARRWFTGNPGLAAATLGRKRRRPL
jgi:DNA (cytosine-5)-methyltransferase 1